MTDSINTGKYYSVHLKQPRGFGFWWFGDLFEDWTFSFTGTYSDAKRAALEAARAQNMTNVLYVLP